MHHISRRKSVDIFFSETLKKLRTEKGLSQRDLAKQMYVNKSTIARWESGVRLPDAAMISRLSKCLGVDADTMFHAAAKSDDSPNVILVDDRKIILADSLPVLEEVLPNAAITGFLGPADAIEYAKTHRIALAFLDIELGKSSGLTLCQALLEINPCTNVVFLTAYSEYSLDAWSTGASGFMLKPLTPEGIRKQLSNLRYPFLLRGAGE